MITSGTTITPTVTQTVNRFSTTTVFVPTTVGIQEYKLTILSDPKEIPIEGSGKYPAGHKVTISAPDQSGEYMFLVWELDGTIQSDYTRPQFSLTMNDHHTLKAYYFKPDELAEILDTIRGAFGLAGAAQDYGDITKSILQAAQKGETLFKVTSKLSPKATAALARLGKSLEVLSFGLDLAQIGTLIANSKLSAEKKMERLGEILSENIATLVAITPCIVVASAQPTLILGGVAVCTFGAAVGVTIAQNKDRILSDLRNAFNFVRSRLQELVDYLYKKLLKIVGGSGTKFLVADPSGRRTGAILQDGSWRVYDEIPFSYYSGLDTHPQVLIVPDPESGRYVVRICSLESESFHLTTSVIADGVSVKSDERSATVEPGAIQQLEIDTSETSNQPDIILMSLVAAITAGIVLVSSEILLRRQRYRCGRRRR
jgi:hypothetical protein